MKIAFLGLGEMGQRMANALLEANYDVVVWNRSMAKAKALMASGATLAPSPRAAVIDADFVFSMVRDDEASEYIWLDGEHGALQGMKAGAIAVECSTVSVNHIKMLHCAFEEASRPLVEAPLAGSRPQAEAKKLIFFVAGSESTVEIVKPVLLRLGAACHFCGPAGSGVAIKLMVNALFGAQVAQFAELISFGRDLQVDVTRALEIISATPVCSPAAAMAAKAMAEKLFAPAFPIDLVSKDFALLAYSAETAKTTLPVSSVVAEVYNQGNKLGFSGANITGIIQLYD